MSDPDIIRLSYRQLGERLGINLHAARMRAKRAEARGEWRIVPGNHPCDIVMVELPVTDALLRGVHVNRMPQSPSRVAVHGPFREGVKAPTQAPVEIEALTSAHARIATLTDRLLAEIEARQQDREAVAAGEGRELMMESEIIRLGGDVEALTAALDRARRPWWRR